MKTYADTLIARANVIPVIKWDIKVFFDFVLVVKDSKETYKVHKHSK